MVASGAFGHNPPTAKFTAIGGVGGARGRRAVGRAGGRAAGSDTAVMGGVGGISISIAVVWAATLVGGSPPHSHMM